jgi:hypothetical protein
MTASRFLRSLPGILAVLLLTAATTIAATSGAASLFYEGWGQPVSRMPSYLAPAAALLIVGLVALRWPRAGSVLLLVGGTAAVSRWLVTRMQRGIAPADVLIVQALVMVGPIVVAALSFLFEARHRRLLRQEGVPAPRRWLARRWREFLLVGAPAVGVAVLSVQQLPALLARHDDGQRGSRVIAGNGVTLVWAPQGPGWNWREPGVGQPSWQALTEYGSPPAGRCAYLSEDGTSLLDKPAHIWRVPTPDEIVRSLTRGGANAGCEWDGRAWHAACRTPPDKETPLWAPDEAPIYYWSNREAGAASAFAVNYTGGLGVLPKAGGGLGVGFRCVRAVADGR